MLRTEYGVHRNDGVTERSLFRMVGRAHGTAEGVLEVFQPSWVFLPLKYEAKDLISHCGIQELTSNHQDRVLSPEHRIHEVMTFSLAKAQVEITALDLGKS